MLPHDLLDAEEARAMLNMPQAKFELLMSSGQVPNFRSSGRTCFRREDIATLALKRQASQAQAVGQKLRAPKPSDSENATQKGRDKYSVTRQTLPSLKSQPQTVSSAVQARIQTVPKSESRIERVNEETLPAEEDDQTSVVSQSKRNKGAWLLYGGVVLSILAVSFTVIGARHDGANPPVPIQAPNSSTFANCKAAPGLVEAVSGERPLSFEVGGKLHAVFVEEGQTVKAGDPIAELENADLIAKLKSSKADLSAAEARLGILKGNLENNLRKAESEVRRLKAELCLLEPRQEDIDQATADVNAMEADARRLAEDEQKYSDPKGRGTSWSIQIYDQTRRLSEAAAAKLASARAHLRALEAGSRPEEKDRARAMLTNAEAEVTRQSATSPFQLQSAQAQLDQCRAQVDLAMAELEKTKIMSAIDGTVVRKYMHPGEVIDALHPQPVVTVADMSKLRVRADVDEADFPRIGIGQRVKITADALGDGKFFSGTVAQVSYVTGQKRFSTGEAKERMDVKIVETIVKFDSDPPAKFVKLGLRVTALFEVAK